MKKNFFDFALSSLLTLCLISVFGCVSAPKFAGGIRMVSYEGIFSSQSTRGPIPGILVDGYIEGSGGPSSKGSITEFEGLTGAYGIYDSASAVTDASWYVQFTFDNVLPACQAPASGVVYVEPNGHIFNGTCYVYGQ